MQDRTITWQVDFNDPDPIGWFTFGFYGLALALCVVAARAALRPAAVGAGPGAREELIGWRCLAWLLFFLGLNKQLDLQVLLAQLGRKVALEHGWYGHKLAIRGVFLLALASVVLLCGWLLYRATHGFWHRHTLCVWGVALLVFYAGERAVPWEQVFGRAGRAPKPAESGERPLWWIEVGGLACISWRAWGSRRAGT